MLKLIILATVQSLLLTTSQVFLKLASMQMDQFSFSLKFFRDLLFNWQLALSGISIATATAIWLYILRHYELSVAYPMISISYVFGMFAAVFIFNEIVPITRWIGVGIIIIGIGFLTIK
jgi:undecaprenyl phosphate-alpha-L-ara4N flippase subunit ArnE